MLGLSVVTLSSVDILLIKGISLTAMVVTHAEEEGIPTSITESISGRENCHFCETVAQTEKKEREEKGTVEIYKPLLSYTLTTAAQLPTRGNAHAGTWHAGPKQDFTPRSTLPVLPPPRLS